MMPALLLLLLVVPLAELWVIVQVAGHIGVVETIALLIVVSLAGAWLLKHEGLATWRRLQSSLAAGRMPTNEVTDGALILMGGALLLTPGFITDLAGLVMLLPPSRAVLKRVVRRLAGRWIERRAGGYGIRTARVTRVRRADEVTSSGSRASGADRSEASEDDFRDRP